VLEKTVNLLCEQRVLSVMLVSAFHAFLLSTLRHVKFLHKNVITHMFFHVRNKSVKHVFSSVNM
jgi:hypothetical protein